MKRPKMRRVSLLLLMLCVLWIPSHGQVEFTLHGGVALPALASGNAPELRTSFATGLRLSYPLATGGSGWLLTADMWQVREFGKDSPDISIVPLDTSFHVKRYQLIPFTLGAAYRIPFGETVSATLYASLGGYFRYINCQRQSAVAVVDDMGESGWGFAARMAAELALWQRLTVELWFSAMGNPFEDAGSPLPGSKALSLNRSHWHLDGYRQCFLGCSLGYRF